MVKKSILFLLAVLFSFSVITSAGIPVIAEEAASDAETVIVMPARFTRTPNRGSRGGEMRAWDEVSSYFINFGKFQDEMLAYDVAIVDSEILTAADVNDFNSAGVWAIARVSVGEEATLSYGDRMGPGGFASYYIYDAGGQPIKNPLTNAFYVDAGSAVWQSIIFRKVAGLLTAGYDGVYLETLETADSQPDTFIGMCRLIKNLKQAFPDAKIVLENGFSIVPTVAPYIDALLYEYFCTYFHSARNKFEMYEEGNFAFRQHNAVYTVNAVRQDTYFPVFALEGFTVEESDLSMVGLNFRHIFNTAWAYDFIPYIPLGGTGTSLYGDVTAHELVPSGRRGFRALEPISIPEPVVNGDITEANIAYAGNGAVVTVDSTYVSYKGGSVLNDGFVGNAANIDIIDWSEICWASEETEGGHWIEIALAAPAQVTEIIIDWALDGGEFFSSRSVKVEAFIGNDWVEIGSVSDIARNTPKTVVSLDCGGEGALKVRVVQESGKGSMSRSNLMWVSEVSLYA